MQRRGIEDPRFVTVARAGWINRENNVSSPALKPGAQPIELISSPGRGDHAVASKHKQEEMGYTERGEAGGKVTRPKDSDVFDEKGQHVTETRQVRGREETYVALLGHRRQRREPARPAPPGAGPLRRQGLAGCQ